MKAGKILETLFVISYMLGGLIYADPTVDNVQAHQRPGSGLIDIHFNLVNSSGFPAQISLEISNDGGGNYSSEIKSLSGDFGNVRPGVNRHVVWDAFEDLPGVSSDRMRIRIIASSFVDIVPMVEVPEGSFEMGDHFAEGDSDELPVRTVYLSTFSMGETEVTWAQWQSVREWAVDNGYSFDSAGEGKANNHPVQKVNWSSAVLWCNAASEKEQLDPVYVNREDGSVFRGGSSDGIIIDYSRNGYRLPNEAEWEKAARGGLVGKRFPWGDFINHSNANYYAYPSEIWDTTNEYEYGFHRSFVGTQPYTSPVKSFAANGFGLYDMVGNVAEWCNDDFDADGSQKVFRGVGWKPWRYPRGDNLLTPRVSDRDGTTYGFALTVIGFRICRN